MVRNAAALTVAAVVFALAGACGDGEPSADSDAMSDPALADAGVLDASANDALPTDAGAEVDVTAPDAAPDAMPTARVTIVTIGGGGGRVAAGGTDVCPGRCTLDVTVGTTLDFTAVANVGSMFAGWDGPCHGQLACPIRA